MRVFLRTKTTGLYYCGSGGLGASLGQAREFADVPAAARCAIAEQLADAEIVLRCDCLDREVPLPVMPLWCGLDRDDNGPSRRPTPSVARAALRPSVLS